MNTVSKTLLNIALAASAIVVGVTGSGAVTAHAAQAASVSCGSIQCSVGSQQSATGGETSTPPSSGNTGGNGGGTAPPVNIEFRICAYWYAGAEGDFQASDSYPDPDAKGNWQCNFERQMSDIAKDLPVCLPLADGRVAYGRKDVYAQKADGSNGALMYYYCSYPLLQYVTPTITVITSPTGGIGDFYKVGSAAMTKTYGTTGTKADSTGYRTTAFKASKPSVVTLNQTFPAKTLIVAGQPSYGYYRLQWKKDYTQYKHFVYPAFLNKAAKYEHIKDYSTTTVDAYTYGCNLSPALVAGVNSKAIFDPAACAGAKWQCNISGSIKNLNTTNSVQVMRDGSHIPVTFPTFTVSGAGAKNVRVQQTRTAVNTNTVSPVNGVGSDANLAKQYFSSSWKWNTWAAYAPTSKKYIAFYWASDSGKSFKYTQTYRFTAEFLVPTQSGIGAGTTSKWVADTTECDITKTSNVVTVLRSAGSK